MLLQSEFNYRERDMDVCIFIPKIIQSAVITSRIGIEREAIVFDEYFDFYTYIDNIVKISKKACIMVDEAQFLCKNQVLQLCQIVDRLDIPVLCYGLRSDFKGEPFEGSKYLLTLADKLIELKTICYCGKKAIMNLRKKVPIPEDTVKATGENTLKNRIIPITEGSQVDIGGNDKYIALCRKCYFDVSGKNCYAQ